MKTRIFRATWYNSLVNNKPSSLWVVRFGREYREITRYFATWQDAVDYVFSGRAAETQRLIYLGMYEQAVHAGRSPDIRLATGW